MTDSKAKIMRRTSKIIGAVATVLIIGGGATTAQAGPTVPSAPQPQAGTPDGTIYKIICDGTYRGWIGWDDYVNGHGDQDVDEVVIKDGAADGYRVQAVIELPDGSLKETTVGGKGTVRRLKTHITAGQRVNWAVSVNNFDGKGGGKWLECETPGVADFPSTNRFIE